MKLPEPAELSAALTDRFGLAIGASVGTSEEGEFADFRPTELHENEAFSVRTTIGWRHILAQLHVGTFAADLLREMGAADADRQARFSSFVELVANRGGRITMAINGSSVDATRADSWPEEWRSLAITIERSPILIDHENTEAMRDSVLFWGGSLLGMSISLLPVIELSTEVTSEVAGLPEGARQRVEVNRYERNSLNRALCIAVQGTTCAVCGFNFAAIYGELGRDFIHVHHVVPVSQLGPGYVIDPGRDLVPLCPNCHAMIHRRDPPFSVDDLRRQIRHR